MRTTRNSLVLPFIFFFLFSSVLFSQITNLWLNPGFEKGTGGSFGDSGFCISNWTQWGGSGSQHNDFNHTSSGQRAVKIWNGDSGLGQYIDITDSYKGMYKFSGFARSPSNDALNGWIGKMEVQWLSNTRDVGHCNVGIFSGNGGDAYNSWKYMSRELVKPAAANGVKLNLCMDDNGNPVKGGALSWDDVVLQKVAAMSNQIQNASFEQNGFNGWGFWNIDAKSTNNTYQSGAYSVKIGLSQGQTQGAMIQELTCFSQGQTIYASAWGRIRNYNGNAKLKLEFWDDQNMISAWESVSLDQNCNWTELSITTNVPQNTTKVKFLLYLNDSSFGSNEEIYFDNLYISTSPHIVSSGDSSAASDQWLNSGFEKGTGGSFGDPGFCISNWTKWGGSGSQHSDFNHTPGGQRAVKIWNGDSGLYQHINITNRVDGMCKFSGFARSPSDDALNGWTGKMEVQWLSNARDVGHYNVGFFYGNGADSYNSWKYMSRELVKPAAANGVKLNLCMDDNGNPVKGGSLSWDDIVLQEVEAMPNQITNYSFEQNGFSGWGFWDINAKNTNSNSHYGDYSVKIELPSGRSEGAMLQELTCFSPGQTIYSSVWGKIKNYNGIAKLKLEFWNNQTLILVKDSIPLAQNCNWTELSISTNVPSNTTKVKLLLYLNDSSFGPNEEVYFDDVYVSTSPYTPYKKGINCGGDSYIASDMKKYEADQFYHGGRDESNPIPIANTADSYLYQTGRWGYCIYSFWVPNGVYKLNLKFAEIWNDLSIDGEQKRIFNVSVQNKLVKERFDIIQTAGFGHAIDYDFITEVKNGQLDISDDGLIGEPKISAIYVEQLPWNPLAPSKPLGFVAIPRSNVIFLNWKNCTNAELKKYKIYRSRGNTNFSLIGTTASSKYKDESQITNGRTYHYYVTAVDYWNNESVPSSNVSVVPVIDAPHHFMNDISKYAWKRYLGDVPENCTSSNPDRGIPLGGFGSGLCMYNIDGSFGPWNAIVSKYSFRKMNLDGAAFHIYQKIGANSPVIKTLSTDKVLKPVWDKINVGQASYYALVPKGWVTYNGFDVDLSCEFYSPIIANNYKETSYPVAVWEWKIYNPTQQTAEVSLMLTFPNVNSAYFGQGRIRKGYVNNHVVKENVSGVVMKASHNDNAHDTDNSEFCIATKPRQGDTVSYVNSWNANGDGSDIWNDFSQTGVLDNGSLDSSYSGAAMAYKVTLAPGESITIPMTISWDFPIYEFGYGTQWWRKYHEYFNDANNNSFNIACTALTNNSYQDWRNKIDGWMTPYLYNPTYPDWVKTASFNELYYAQFGSCFYESGLKSGHDEEFMGLHPEDHKHFLLECMPWSDCSPSDLRHYYSIVYAAFWPTIEKENLMSYADGMIYYNPMKGWPSGNMLHDFGDPERDPFFEFDSYRNICPNMPFWVDTPSRFIQQCWRYYYMYNDKAFLNYVWPACKATYQYMQTTDTKNLYLPNNSGNDSTYDYTSLEGISSHCGSIWIGALTAMKEMAAIEGDSIFSDVTNWLGHAKVNFDSELWSAENQYYQKDTDSETSTGIFADGLMGQLYNREWGLDDILPSGRMKSTLGQIYQKCVVPMKDYTGDGIGDVGAYIGKRQDGSMLYPRLDKIVTAVNYVTGALMNYSGLTQEALHTGFGSYYPVYAEDSTAFWFNTPEIWYTNLKSAIPVIEQYARPMGVWEYTLSFRNPVHDGIAVASSYGNAFIPNNVLDGNSNTRWSSDANDNEWIYLFYMTPKMFNKIQLKWEAAYGRRYNIQVSDDGAVWSTIFSKTNGSGGTELISVNAQSARYIRLQGIQRGTVWGYSLYEFQPVLEVTANASSSTSTNFSAKRAIDGNVTTWWSSTGSNPQWISIDYKKTTIFNTVKLNWKTAAYASKYDIQLSDDGTTWTTVYSRENGTGGLENISIGQKASRYIRLYCRQRGTCWGYSLCEFSVERR